LGGKSIPTYGTIHVSFLSLSFCLKLDEFVFRIRHSHTRGSLNLAFE